LNLALNSLWDSTEFGQTPRTTTPVLASAESPSRKADASTVQPGVMAFWTVEIAKAA
jgi:hypothetical protein